MRFSMATNPVLAPSMRRQLAPHGCYVWRATGLDPSPANVSWNLSRVDTGWDWSHAGTRKFSAISSAIRTPRGRGRSCGVGAEDCGAQLDPLDAHLTAKDRKKWPLKEAVWNQTLIGVRSVKAVLHDTVIWRMPSVGDLPADDDRGCCSFF